MGHTETRAGSRRRLAVAFGVVAGLAVAGSVVAADTVNPTNNHTYDVVTTGSITWSDANAAAGQMKLIGNSACQGHLVTVTSADEASFLKSTFGLSLNVKWMGGFQDSLGVEPGGGWGWVTGEAWAFTDWRGGEPNNAGGTENALRFFGDGTWNDAPENFLYGPSGGYVVEYDCKVVDIDIKPGSFPNSVNNNGNGVIPVAILTTDTFDASTVDPATVTLDGAAAKMKGKSGNSGSLEDVDGDGDLDLVVQIQDTDGTYVAGDSVAILTATTFSGDTVTGSDTIRLVPPTS